ncbi:FGGY-family carbohydrate kinase [Caldinitratiruptor microaerophilus]|uniref:Xylulokinase n=1 Tax=Caldinitratiruptor microaerophilus TaxID=671077 RepID=A0AA35G6Z0_9FIRM|nr:FGGY-family carbohydrate kinase [Caldinitratiruptor microaerophilus]BDG62056.1 xylulokinase [Caldinitratiruptor microaerophilus]
MTSPTPAAPSAAGGARILAVDVGTTGTRAMLFDLEGRPHGMAYREYRSHFLTPSVIDHDPQTWLDAVDAAVPEVLRSTATPGEAIVAIAVTSQRATILPVDAAGQPLSPAILWQDKRTLEQCRQIEATVGPQEVYARTGLRIDPYFSLPKLLWFRQVRPEVYRQAHRFLTVHDFVVHHLTGEFVTEWTQASRTMLFQVDHFRWDEELAGRLGIDIERMPRALPPGSVAGTLTRQAAERLGLPASVPVVMAGGDQQCAALGLGVTRPGLAKVTTGTGSFVVAPVNRPYRDPQARVLCSASAVAGGWILEAGIFTSGSVYRWVRDELSVAETTAGATLGLDPYDLLNLEAARAAPGAGGLVVIPHFAGSAAPYWNPLARGVIFNLALGHRRADLIRAVLEGIALEVGKNLAIIEALVEAGDAGSGLREIRVSGGAVRSDLFNQIQADVYGRRVVPGKLEQATALGAAILAAAAVGAYPDVQTAAGAMSTVDPSRAREPDLRRHAIYQEIAALHDAVYRALADAGVYERAAAVARLLQELGG